MRAMLVAAMLLAFVLTGVLTGVLAGALTGAQAQQMYRWIDKHGGVHYTQQPPPADAKDVQRRSAASGTADSGDLPYATQLATRNYPVTLFTSADCGQACNNARDSLEKRGVPFEEVVVGDDKSVADLRRVTGKTQVPVLRVGTQVEVGYEPEGWKAALDAARYPASGPPVRGRSKAEAAGPLPVVKLYTAAECGGLCDEARNTLAARRVKFQEVSVAYDNPDAVEELKRVAGGSESVPVLVVGPRVQRGFDSATYHSVLDAAGFPRAGPAAGAPAAKR